MARPRPEPPASLSGLVEPLEGLKDGRMVLDRDARPVVGDDEHAVFSVLLQLQRHGRGRVTFGVAGQFLIARARCLGSPRVRARDGAGVDPDAAPLMQALRLLQDEVVEIDGARGQVMEPDSDRARKSRRRRPASAARWSR